MKSINLLLLFFLACMSSQAQELVSGKASLSRVNYGVYEIKIDSITKRLDIRSNSEKRNQGILSVLFKDCEEVRQSVFQISELTEGNLISTIRKYNSCNYTPFQLTEKEAERAANFQGDQLKLFAKLGVSLNQISFFDSGNTEPQTQGQIGFGIAATPGFLGDLQGNFYFTLEVDAAFSGDKVFNNSPPHTNFRKNSYRENLGIEYHFNTNGTFQPLIGLGVGLSQDHYSGNYGGYTIKESVGNGFINPKAGVLFSLDNKKSLGLILSYIPKQNDDLSFRNEEREVIPFVIDTHYFNAGIYFYF